MDNVILNYVERSKWIYDDNDNEITTHFRLSFSFFNKEYYAEVSLEDINLDYNYVGLEGDSDLFDSFQDLCEDGLWETIKTECLAHEKWIRDEQ